MKLVPRSYQTEAVSTLWDYFRTKTGNPIVAMPTGTGKSLVIGMFTESIFQYPGQRVLMLTHVKELIGQNCDKLKELWPLAPVGVYSAGLGKKQLNFPITFAGIASVAKKAKSFGRIDIVLIDECHLVSPSEATMYRKFLDELRTQNPRVKVVGFTATPWRIGVGSLTEGGIFTDVCFDITDMNSFNRLIQEGFLAPLIPKRTKEFLDVTGVHTVGGEYKQGELQVAVDKQEITYAALKETLELGHDRKHWLVFASGVEHAIHIADMLNDMGITAVAIHSKLTTDERDAAIAGFKSGKYRAAVNNNVLTTGFDFPGIDLIVILRPTQSVILWVQMLGRGTRPCEGKENCLVLDFARNTPRLGPINDPLIPHKKGSKGGTAPIKECDFCGTYNHASLRHCVGCGAEFSFKVKLKTSAGEDELIKPTEVPIIETFKVDHITYGMHQKDGRPPSVKVSYYCGLKMFNEFVCFEHEGFAGRKARQWWRERVVNPENVPGTVLDALHRLGEVAPVSHLRVHINKKYPEILAHCIDGSAFGTQPPVHAPPTQDVKPVAFGAPPPAQDEWQEDDIPF